MGNTGRVLLRKSGTEPLIRVMVEAENEADAEHWATYIAEAVQKASDVIIQQNFRLYLKDGLGTMHA